MKRILLAFALLCSLVGTSWSATYYVDFVAGADTNNGTATGTAFKHCPGDASATNTAASTTLAAGDTVVFKGGVSYKGTITVSWSGSAENPITYNGNDGAWGTGNAIINNENDNTLTTAFSASAKDYIDIKNFEIVDIGGYTDAYMAGIDNTNCELAAKAGTAINLGTGSSYFNITNVYMHELGVWQNQPGVADGTINGVAINTRNASNVVIDNVECTKMKTCLSIQIDGAVENIEVKNSKIHDYMYWLIDIAHYNNSGDTIDNVLIHNNELHDYYQYDSGTWVGCGEKPHTDGIFFRNDYDGLQYSGIKIYNNKFWDSTSSAAGTSAIYFSTGTGGAVYNNLFINIGAGRDIGILYGPRAGQSTQYVQIWNNTFINGGTNIALRDADHNADIRNNLFIDTRTGFGYIINSESGATSKPDTLDNNIYMWARASGDIYLEASANTLAEMRSSLGFEVGNSLGSTDPLFVDSSNGYTDNAYLNDYRLQAESPVIGKGADLSLYFTTDINGTARGSTWDSGAYQYATTTDNTPSAFSFTDVTGAALSTQYTSDNVTVLGIDNTTTLALTGTGCEYSINGAAFATADDNVSLNDNVALRVTSSGSYSTAKNCVLNLGGVTDTYSVTTLAAVLDPVAPRMRAGSMSGGWR